MFGIRRRPEDNSRNRHLPPEDGKSLRKTLHSRPEWVEHEPELDPALSTGLRCTDMCRAASTGERFELRVATLPPKEERHARFILL